MLAITGQLEASTYIAAAFAGNHRSLFSTLFRHNKLALSIDKNSKEGRMDTQVRNIYLKEIEAQASFALNAIGAINNALDRFNKAHDDHNSELTTRLHQEIFRTLHSFLTHASNVSRLLWPAPPRRQRHETKKDYDVRCLKIFKLVRGADLRSALGLPEHGHVLKSRKLRDHLEHFDERLDEWQRTSVRRNFVQDIIAPKGAISGFEESDMMRWFDPQAKAVYFRGQEYDIQQLVDGVSEIHKKVREATNIDFSSY